MGKNIKMGSTIFTQDIHTKFVIVHYSEIALKKGKRSWFEAVLVDNIKAKLHQFGIREVRRLAGRIIIEFNDMVPWNSVGDKIKMVFGVASASPVYCLGLTMAELVNTAASCLEKMRFDSFAVRTKRSEKRFPLTSPEISAELGAVIQERTGAKVDLETPETVFNVEVTPEGIFFFFQKVKGPGGLPSGASGRLAVLISGGIDSPVAAWKMMKRGCRVNFIHFHSKPFTDDASVEKVEEVVELLAKWQGRARLALVPFGEVQKKIVTAVPAKYRVVIYRRFMFRIAGLLAAELGAEAIVTGEALGQVASQTLSNMCTIETVASLPVLRPLIGMDKQEIVDAAKDIGTFDLSIRPHQDCCSFLQPPNPVTRTTIAEVDKVEELLDVAALVKEVVSGVSFMEIK